MSREALKFIDLDGFLSVMEESGFGPQAHAMIYEENEEPYCSAYLLPTELLPADFDLDLMSRFGGTLTQVHEVNFLGTERYFTDFMIYPLSRTGYLEVDCVLPVTFADDKSEKERDWKHMIFVINLEDGGGQEFFLSTTDKLISLAVASTEQPREFKTYEQAEKKVDQLREKYPATCQLYSVDRKDFDRRRALIQTAPDPPSSE